MCAVINLSHESSYMPSPRSHLSKAQPEGGLGNLEYAWERTHMYIWECMQLYTYKL
jgi:hypothetical protein